MDYVQTENVSMITEHKRAISEKKPNNNEEDYTHYCRHIFANMFSSVAVCWFIRVKIPYHIRICVCLAPGNQLKSQSNRLVGAIYSVQAWHICKKSTESYLNVLARFWLTWNMQAKVRNWFSIYGDWMASKHGNIMTVSEKRIVPYCAQQKLFQCLSVCLSVF